jgi:hypothetical protein
MDTQGGLRELIQELQSATSGPGLTTETVVRATERLATLGHRYNTSLFPPLPVDHDWGLPSKNHPRTLAEALLWKMGKWQVYQKFASHYLDGDSNPSGTDMVFFAFAKHLRERNNPIYDQHALRSLWAIDTGFSDEDRKTCRSLLLVKSGEWKPIASGSHTARGYDLFIRRIAFHSSGEYSASKSMLDTLLMPLVRPSRTPQLPMMNSAHCVDGTNEAD